MVLDPNKIQKEIDYITSKSKEMGIDGTDLVRIRNSIKKAAAAQDQAVADAALKGAYAVLKKGGTVAKSTGPFQHYYIGNHGVDYETAKKHLNRRIDGVTGSVQNIIDKGAKSLMSALSPDDAHNMQREIDSYNLLLSKIKQTIDQSMSKNPKVYKILMDYLIHMIEKARHGFNNKFQTAKATGKWQGGSTENLNTLGRLSQDLIRSTSPEQAKIVTDQMDDFDLIVAIDDLDDEPVASDDPVTSAEPVAEEDFNSKIQNIFREKFDKSYKKAIKESLEK